MNRFEGVVLLNAVVRHTKRLSEGRGLTTFSR